MDERLASAAIARDGYFTRAEAMDCGYGDRDIAAAIRAEEWSRVRPGAYAPQSTWVGLSEEDRQRVKAYAVLDKLGDCVAASHSTGCALHRFAQYDVDWGDVHVTRLDDGAGRREAGVNHHTGQAVRSDDVIEVDGRLCMRPARAVWEAATLTSARGGLVVIDSALHLHKMTPDDLAAAGVDFDKWIGSRRVDVVARLADPHSETAGESLTRYLCYEQRLPRPNLQYLVRDESGQVVARTDFAWEEYAHVGEFDGAVKYTRDLRPGEDATAVVVREKQREDKVRRQRLGMSRVVWADVMPARARATGITLWRDLEQSRSLYLHNRVSISV